jgi:hypothetical protein
MGSELKTGSTAKLTLHRCRQDGGDPWRRIAAILAAAVQSEFCGTAFYMYAATLLNQSAIFCLHAANFWKHSATFPRVRATLLNQSAIFCLHAANFWKHAATFPRVHAKVPRVRATLLNQSAIFCLRPAKREIRHGDAGSMDFAP